MFAFLQLLSHTSFCCFPWITNAREFGHPARDTSYCSRTASPLELLWSRAKFQGFFSIIIPVIMKPGVRQGLEHCKWKERAATELRRKHLLASRVTISHNRCEQCELVMQPLYWSPTAGQRLFTLHFHSSVHVLEKGFWCAVFTLLSRNRKICKYWPTISWYKRF